MVCLAKFRGAPFPTGGEVLTRPPYSSSPQQCTRQLSKRLRVLYFANSQTMFESDPVSRQKKIRFSARLPAFLKWNSWMC